MRVYKNGELVARWAEEFGYNVFALFLSPGSITLTLKHPTARTRRVRVADHSSCGGREDWSVEPLGMEPWQVVKKLAEESGAVMPAWIVRAQRKQEAEAKRFEEQFLHCLDLVRAEPAQVWRDGSAE